MGSPGCARSSAWIWLFSSTERDDGVSRQVDVQADYITALVGELGIVRLLERPDGVLRQLAGFRNALRRATAYAGLLGKQICWLPRAYTSV